MPVISSSTFGDECDVNYSSPTPSLPVLESQRVSVRSREEFPDVITHPTPVLLDGQWEERGGSETSRSWSCRYQINDCVPFLLSSKMGTWNWRTTFPFRCAQTSTVSFVKDQTDITFGRRYSSVFWDDLKSFHTGHWRRPGSRDSVGVVESEMIGPILTGLYPHGCPVGCREYVPFVKSIITVVSETSIS